MNKEYVIIGNKTKLKEKLIELGYDELFENCYVKELKYCDKVISFNENNEIVGNVNPFAVINTQQDIDNLQQAFNELQKDLEILK